MVNCSEHFSQEHMTENEIEDDQELAPKDGQRGSKVALINGIIDHPISNEVRGVPETKFSPSSTGETNQEQGASLHLPDFEDKCPPGGSDSVIVYTTSLRGIRKTFEDCHAIKFLLDSFRIVYYERDVSMDLEFREELWRVLGGRVTPPRLFIRGRHVGGADEVVHLHEQGKLHGLLDGIPLASSSQMCRACAGARFVLCSSCNGSRKVFKDDQNDGMLFARCCHCNENGLIKCPICCC
ncbi:hypothetical protein Ancab_015070 [Ancistrocladus abbreviatus]